MVHCARRHPKETCGEEVHLELCCRGPCRGGCQRSSPGRSLLGIPGRLLRLLLYSRRALLSYSPELQAGQQAQRRPHTAQCNECMVHLGGHSQILKARVTERVKGSSCHANAEFTDEEDTPAYDAHGGGPCPAARQQRAPGPLLAAAQPDPPLPIGKHLHAAEPNAWHQPHGPRRSRKHSRLDGVTRSHALQSRSQRPHRLLLYPQ